jgi:hypothetical protein
MLKQNFVNNAPACCYKQVDKLCISTINCNLQRSKAVICIKHSRPPVLHKCSLLAAITFVNTLLIRYSCNTNLFWRFRSDQYCTSFLLERRKKNLTARVNGVPDLSPCVRVYLCVSTSLFFSFCRPKHAARTDIQSHARTRTLAELYLNPELFRVSFFSRIYVPHHLPFSSLRWLYYTNSSIRRYFVTLATFF